MVKARKKTVKKRVKPRKKTVSKRKPKTLLEGFTKNKGGYQLVFKRGSDRIVDPKKFKTKKALVSQARKFI